MLLTSVHIIYHKRSVRWVSWILMMQWKKSPLWGCLVTQWYSSDAKAAKIFLNIICPWIHIFFLEENTLWLYLLHLMSQRGHSICTDKRPWPIVLPSLSIWNLRQGRYVTSATWHTLGPLSQQLLIFVEDEQNTDCQKKKCWCWSQFGRYVDNSGTHLLQIWKSRTL